MANQRSPRGPAISAELRTTATTANQVLATIDLTALFAKSWNGAVFAVRGSVLSFQEDGSTDYAGFREVLGMFVRRGGTVTAFGAVDPNNDPTFQLEFALSAINFNVSGNTIQLRITPAAGNIRHYGIIEVAAYQYT